MKANAVRLRCAASATLVLISTASPARSNVSLLPADTSSYAVLEGSGGNSLQVNSSPLGGSTIFGNVGLGIENGGNAQFQFNNPAVITGNINFAAGTAYYNNGGGVLQGAINAGVSQVETDLNDLNTLSANLGALSGTSLSINLSGSSGSQTISAGSGIYNARYGAYVFNLTSFSFNNGNTLYINGQGLGANVVINVAEANVDNPHFGGAITLEGGLTPNDVIINFTGENDLTLSGGNTRQTSANNAFQCATFLDPNGDINANCVNVVGHLFGCDCSNLQIGSGATVTIPEPGSMALASLGGCLYLLIWRRRTAV